MGGNVVGNVKPSWVPNGIDAVPMDKNRSVLLTGNLTLTAADSGKTFIFPESATQYTVTLPATAVGLVYYFVYSGRNNQQEALIVPQAADGINGAGTATVVNKGIKNTLATNWKGDWIQISSLAGATGVTAWCVTGQRGIWAKVP